jgi:arylsulfatase A-like enzyme
MRALCLFLALCLAAARADETRPATVAAAAARPNVIVILADDLGWGDLGCQEPLDDAGPEAVVRTPRIDALAAAGVRFTSGYANHMVCSPTRAALLSGGPQQRLGYYGFPETMAAFPAVPLLPEPFRAAGYATGMVGKWHVSFLPGSRPLDRGFERFFGFLGGEHDYFLPNVGQATHGIAGSTDAFVLDQEKPAVEIGYLTDEFTTRAIGFIDEARAAAKPFLLYLAYNAPHTPLQVPWDALEPFARAKGGRFDSRDITRAMIERLDANVGRLLDHLRGVGLDRDTLVIFTSDNGASQPGYAGGLRGRKGQFYEGGIRVPLIVSWPARIPAGQVCHAPVITHDIFPTALAAAGIEQVPETVTGLDWLPHVTAERRPWPERSLHWSTAVKKARWAVRAGRWKLVNEDTWPGIGAWPLKESPKGDRVKPAVEVQLYDLEADPAERRDLAAAEPEVVARLRADIDGFLAGLPPSLATAEVHDRSKAIQREREADPARYPTAPRRDGAPGHWQQAAPADAAVRVPPGITTPRVESFPREGRGYQLVDWRRRTEEFLDAVLDPVRQGDYLPLMWWDDTRINWPHTTFGLPSYVGMKGQWGVHRNAHEAIVTMSTVLSGALVDRDLTRYPVPGSPAPVNLVAMQEAYFSPADGVFLDGIGAKSGGSFWYELFPSILAGALVAEHPAEAPLAEAWRRSCRRWAEAGLHLWRLNDYDFQAYDLRARQAVVKAWREPDAAAGLAFLMQMAAAKWPDEASFRHETRHALDWLCRQDRNLNYEIFTAFGVYAAARCNAEQSTAYDVGKLFGWCFEDSAVRGMSPHWPDVAQGDGYGVVSGRWGDDDVAGLVGVSRGGLSTPTMRGGYAFAMETFAYGWPLVAATRYDNRLARAVGKWMHAAAHSARLFYPDQVPPDRQSDWAWAEKHTAAIPYEGIMERDNRTGSPGPFASGDPTNQGWGPLNIGIYSGALSGVFGGIVRPTNVPGVLALDTRRMDYFSTAAIPATLLYNPGSEPAAVRLPVGPEPVRAWEAVGNRWLAAAPVSGELIVTVPPDDAVLVSLVPGDLEPHFAHGRLAAGEVIVDFSVPTPAVDAAAAVAPAGDAAPPPAAAGVRFSRGYVTAPQCVPSRAGLLTGIHQNRFGVED